MPKNASIDVGQILSGPLFSEPMRVETVRKDGDGAVVAGLVGLKSKRFRGVRITPKELDSLTILETAASFDGDGKLLRLGLQAYSLRLQVVRAIVLSLAALASAWRAYKASHWNNIAGSLGMSGMTLADASAKPDNNFNLMRLVAAWAVIYGHSYAVSAEGGQDLIIRLLNFKFSGGIAVDVFFVISGFLIAASLERNRLPSFLMSRAIRILPGLVVCVGFCAFVLGPLLTTVTDYWRHPEVWRYFVANAGLRKNTEYFLPGVFETLRSHAINGSLWSLPIEARLYLWLAAFGLLSLNRSSRFNPIFILLMTIGFLLLTRGPLSPEKSNLAYCQAFFLAGAFAWINRSAIPLSWPLLFAILVFAASLHNTGKFFIGYFLALSYGTLFLAYVPKLPVIRHHDISYGLYLYGWPSQQLVQTFAPSTGPIGNTIWATLLAGTFAAASWRLVESPAMRIKSRFRIKSRVKTDATSATEPATPRTKGTA